MKRFITAALLIPAVVMLVFQGHPFLFIFLVALVATFCFHEFSRLAAEGGAYVNFPLGFLAGNLLIWMPSYDPVFLLLPLLVAMAWNLRNGDVTSVLPKTATLALAVVYCFGPWRCARELRVMGPHWLLFALALNWVGDIAAFYAGSFLGRRKLAPGVSPAKTWEGAVASAVASVGFGVIFLARFAPERHLLEVAALSAVANVAGQIGDLSESALKRGAGVKDSGTLLPGHGGWLDRLDSSLFSMPVVYFWLSRSAIW